MYNTKHKIKRFNSPDIPIKSIACSSVVFGKNSIPVGWYVLQNKCDKMLAGNPAKQLRIIDFKPTNDVFKQINKIIKGKDKENLQQILEKYSQSFKVSRKLKGHHIKLHKNEDINPKVEPQKTIPCQVQGRVEKVIKEIIDNEENSTTEPTRLHGFQTWY